MLDGFASPQLASLDPLGPVEGFIAFMLSWFLLVLVVLLILPRRWTQIAFGEPPDETDLMRTNRGRSKRR